MSQYLQQLKLSSSRLQYTPLRDLILKVQNVDERPNFQQSGMSEHPRKKIVKNIQYTPVYSDPK